MKEKIRHHPFLTAIILGSVFYAAGVCLGILVHAAFWSLAALGVVLYIACLIWLDGKYELVCPSCGYSPWSKTNYYCARCGTKLVFKGKQKVKLGKEVNPEKISEPTCSRGHQIYSFDKYCGKCGEKLHD